MKNTLLSTALLFSLAACGAGDAPADGGGGAGDPAAASDGGAKAQTVAVESGVREVRCGCRIDEVGHCGNYVHVGDEWLEISNPDDHGLGAMEWCKVKIKVEATVAGTKTGDKIAVETLQLASR